MYESCQLDRQPSQRELAGFRVVCSRRRSPTIQPHALSFTSRGQNTKRSVCVFKWMDTMNHTGWWFDGYDRDPSAVWWFKFKWSSRKNWSIDGMFPSQAYFVLRGGLFYPSWSILIAELLTIWWWGQIHPVYSGSLTNQFHVLQSAVRMVRSAWICCDWLSICLESLYFSSVCLVFLKSP